MAELSRLKLTYMKLFKHILKTIALLAIVLGCTNNSESNQETEQLELNALKNEIVQLTSEGICTENSDCAFIAFGSKPCGGPWSYLVYSTSIDVELLEEKIATYNQNETDFNIKWGIFSDCSFASPPEEVRCVNGECTAIF